MRLRPVALALLLPLVGVLGAESLSGQRTDASRRAQPQSRPPMAVPFGPGERMEYDVRLGALGRRGDGYMEVISVDTVRGRAAYHVAMAYSGGLLFAKVSDHYQSWFDIHDLMTLRFIQDIDQLNYERYKHFEIFPEERRFERRDAIVSGDMPTDRPLDDVSFFYFARTLPLEVGAEYIFDRYFRENGNPVILRVLRRDTVEVPAGRFATIVVQPIIQTSGLFGQGGEAELYFSDDERRILVLMRSKVPLIGSLSLHLRSVREGVPLARSGGLPPPGQ